MTSHETPGSASAIAFAPAASIDVRERIVRRARRATEQRDGTREIFESRHNDLVLLTTRRPPPGGGRFPLAVAIYPNGRSFTAPCSSLVIEADRIRAHTDHVGLAAVYHTSTRDFSAVSTSALTLAAMQSSQLDEAAWAHLALLGFQLADETPFEGVRRLQAGTAVEIRRGTTRLIPEVTRTPTRALGPALTEVVTELLDQHPRALIELSGGLDSRAILAAIPRSRRRSLTAFTIGGPRSVDVPIARQIAHEHGLQHVVLAEWQPTTSDPEEVRWRVEKAAILYEFQTNALASALLSNVEERAPSGPRFTGVNGEYVRGFYYPGTTARTHVSHRTIGRLVRWRMLTNERVAPSLLKAAWCDHHLDSLESDLTRRLLEHSHYLRPAMDEFYLYDRVVRWAGPSYTVAAQSRAVLAPFLHPEVLAGARAVHPRARSGSRALARLVCELDPALGAARMASGLRPSDLASSGALSVARRARATSGKVARKVGQRLTGHGRPPSGASIVLDELHEAWRHAPPFAELDGVPFLQERALEGFSRDPGSIDAATASFIVNLSVAQGALNRAINAGDSNGHFGDTPPRGPNA